MQKRSLSNAQNKGVFPARSTYIKFPVEKIDADSCVHHVAIALSDVVRMSLPDCVASVCDRIHEIANSKDDSEEIPEWAWPGPHTASAVSVLAYLMAAFASLDIAYEHDKKEFKAINQWLSELDPSPELVRSVRMALKGTAFEIKGAKKNARCRK